MNPEIATVFLEKNLAMTNSLTAMTFRAYTAIKNKA
jgi:hypothetical protein